jgi:SAM-dependent methyltransferase
MEVVMTQLNTSTDPFYSGWDEKYREQAGDAEAWSSEPQPFVQKVVESLAANSAVADLGCGDGRNTRVLVEAGHRVVAVDLAPIALKQLLDRFASLKMPAPTAVHANLEGIPLASEQFDAALAADVLPQVRHLRRAMEEVHRILKSKGRLYVNVFTLGDCAFGEGEQIAPRSFLYKSCLFNFFEPDDMRRLCAGLFNIMDEELVSWWDPPHVPFRPLRHRHEALFYILQKP